MSKILLLITLVLTTQSALANKLLSPFFAEQVSNSVRLSPNGEYYLHATFVKNETQFTLHQSVDQSIINTIDVSSTFDESTLFRNIKWLDNQHVAIVLIDKEEVETSLFERNIQTRLVIIDMLTASAQPIIYEVTTPGQLIEAAPNQQGVFYFSRNAHKSKVYKIHIKNLLKINHKRNKLTRVDGGQFVAKNVIAQVDGFAMRWFFEPSGLPSAVLYIPEVDEIELALFETSADSGELIPKSIKKWDKEALNKENNGSSDISNNNSTDQTVFFPLAKSGVSNEFYAIDYHQDEALSLYSINYETDEYKRIFDSPGLPIQDIIFSKNKVVIGVVVLEQGLYKELYLDDQPNKSNVEQLEITVEESNTNNVKIIYRESHNQAGTYSIKHGQNEDVVVARKYAELPIVLPSRQIVGNIVVDDMDIPYLLTLPIGASKNTPSPLILMPHGGPFNVFDTPYFDPNAQFFAANGIAVLRVNYRGSGGYGITHRDAGKKQWGASMLVELTKALEAVQQRDDIDATKTCSVGMSYGGYASLMLNIQSPDLFKCAVSVAGVTDMNLFLNHSYVSDSQREWLNEYVGSAAKDYDQMLAISPLYQLEKLQTPLLIIHGRKDKRVSVEHGFRAKLLLEKANADYTWSLYEEADHHFAEGEQRLELFSQIYDFVNEHLQ